MLLSVHSRRLRHAIPLLAIAFVVLPGCVGLHMTLPYDDAQPEPEGGRIKPSLGWLTTERDGAKLQPPEGSVAIEVVHLGQHTYLQQVRHFESEKYEIGDSILLDRQTLRPVATWHWTAAGTYMTAYNHRVVERTFRPRKGGSQQSHEILELEPYSALGIEIVIASLPLGEGYKAKIPVVVDTVARGWSWLNCEVQREMTISERADVKAREQWIVDCDLGATRLRYFIALEGRVVRKIQWIAPDNSVTHEVRRMLLGLPQKARK